MQLGHLLLLLGGHGHEAHLATTQAGVAAMDHDQDARGAQPTLPQQAGTGGLAVRGWGCARQERGRELELDDLVAIGRLAAADGTAAGGLARYELSSCGHRQSEDPAAGSEIHGRLIGCCWRWRGGCGLRFASAAISHGRGKQGQRQQREVPSRRLMGQALGHRRLRSAPRVLRGMQLQSAPRRRRSPVSNTSVNRRTVHLAVVPAVRTEEPASGAPSRQRMRR